MKKPKDLNKEGLLRSVVRSSATDIKTYGLAKSIKRNLSGEGLEEDFRQTKLKYKSTGAGPAPTMANVRRYGSRGLGEVKLPLPKTYSKLSNAMKAPRVSKSPPGQIKGTPGPGLMARAEHASVKLVAAMGGKPNPSDDYRRRHPEMDKILKPAKPKQWK